MKKRITDEKRNALLVVAAQLVTLTYQATITPPGGLWQDDLFGPNTTDTFFHREFYQLKLNTTAAHIAGSAIALMVPLAAALFFNALPFARKGIRALRNLVRND